MPAPITCTPKVSSDETTPPQRSHKNKVSAALFSSSIGKHPLPRPLIPFALLHHPCSSLSFLLNNGGPLRIILAADPTPSSICSFPPSAPPQLDFFAIPLSPSISIIFARSLSPSCFLHEKFQSFSPSSDILPIQPPSSAWSYWSFISASSSPKSLLPLHHLQIHSLQVTALCHSIDQTFIQRALASHTPYLCYSAVRAEPASFLFHPLLWTDLPSLTVLRRRFVPVTSNIISKSLDSDNFPHCTNRSQRPSIVGFRRPV